MFIEGGIRFSEEFYREFRVFRLKKTLKDGVCLSKRLNNLANSP